MPKYATRKDRPGPVHWHKQRWCEPYVHNCACQMCIELRNKQSLRRLRESDSLLNETGLSVKRKRKQGRLHTIPFRRDRVVHIPCFGTRPKRRGFKTPK